MFPIFETPILITLIMLFYFLFFFVLFLSKLQGANGKKASKDQGEVAEKGSSECTMFGFLEKLPKGDSIPEDCMRCQKLVECLLKKKAFEWYSGENPPKKSAP